MSEEFTFLSEEELLSGIASVGPPKMASKPSQKKTPSGQQTGSTNPPQSAAKDKKDTATQAVSRTAE